MIVQVARHRKGEKQAAGEGMELGKLTQEQSGLKARVIDGPRYEFPDRLRARDWVMTAVVVLAMVTLLIVGMVL